MSASERGRLLWKIAELVEQHIDELAELETLDNGKPIFESRYVDMPMVADVFRYYAGWATKLHGETVNINENAFTYTLREPVGVVGAIVAWNFPLLLASWKLAPALACGNTVVLKPAEQTPLTALRFGELCRQAGLPAGVLNIVTGGPETGKALVQHPQVDKVAFTGSTVVGKEIMRSAADTLKRVTLELGGKSPNIVFADSDLDNAVKGAINGIFFGKGEVCCAGSRLFVEKKVEDEFLTKLVERAKKLRPGDPLDPKTKLGAIVSEQQMKTVLGYIEAGKSEGAQVMIGGNRVEIGNGKGYFIEPTIFGGVRNDMKIAQEEIFGPVLATLAFDDVEQVAELANRNPVRAGGGDLDARHQEGARAVAAAEGGHGVDQHLRADGCGAAVWRIQAVGLRQGTGSGRAGALHGSEERVVELVVDGRHGRRPKQIPRCARNDKTDREHCE